MVDKEMLEAIGTMLDERDQRMSDMMDEKLDTLRSEINERFDQVDQRTERLEVLLEHDIPHDIQLLAEGHTGHTGIIGRLPEAEEVDTLRSRIRVLERAVTEHTKAINELKQA